MPVTSTLDRSVSLDQAFGAISVIVTSSGSAGHSMVAIEYAQNGVYQNIVADLVPLPHPSFPGRASQNQLKRGAAGGHALKAKVRILGAATGETDIPTKIVREFRSKTWRVPITSLNNAMLQIGMDASASTENPGYSAYQNSPYSYQFLGQFTMVSPQTWGTAHGINCGNWTRKIMESAGIMDRIGLVFDIPRFQALPGWREWLLGFMAGLGITRSPL